jgi:hypothetical protein
VTSRKQHPAELRGRAVALVFELRAESGNSRGTLASVGHKLGINPETLHNWPQSFRRFEGRLLIVMASVFASHVRFSRAVRCAGAPKCPGAHRLRPRRGWSSLRVAGVAARGQAGAGSAQSRCQQVRKASFQGQSAVSAQAATALVCVVDVDEKVERVGQGGHRHMLGGVRGTGRR